MIIASASATRFKRHAMCFLFLTENTLRAQITQKWVKINLIELYFIEKETNDISQHSSELLES